MKEVLESMESWRCQGKPVALASLVGTYGSSPRLLGAKMAISSEGEMAGSVSGGCVETTVVAEAKEVLADGVARLLHFGISNETAWSVGLSCGGEIEVFVESLIGPEMAPLFEEIKESVLCETRVALCTVLSELYRGRKLLVRKDGTVRGDLGSGSLNQWAREQALAGLTRERCTRVQFGQEGRAYDLFFDVLSPSPRLIIIGAVHVAVHLVSMARELGFRTTVVDPRPVFASPERFHHADRLLLSWPTEALSAGELDDSTYIAVLSHDERLDNPALKMALESRCRYIGVLGSRKTLSKRTEELKGMGVTDDQLRRLHMPIGLDLGGRRPEEIALAILAEIVAVRNAVPSAE